MGAEQKWIRVGVKQNWFILSKNLFEQNCKRFYCLVPHHSSYNIFINGNKKIIWAKYLFTQTFDLDPLKLWSLNFFFRLDSITILTCYILLAIYSTISLTILQIIELCYGLSQEREFPPPPRTFLNIFMKYLQRKSK